MESDKADSRAFSTAWEEGSEDMESANRLNILYVFENKVNYTDAFDETIELIMENEEYQNQFFRIIDIVDKNNGPLFNHAFAFITIHIKRLEIPFTDDDLVGCVHILYDLFRLWDKKSGSLLSRITPKR